ncbi:4'-phosphopantetheinyl transferase family protein [Streptomyces sp. NPDC002870]|uniref:4'-phosphopantetheinyl transferase family protein n=1 Tax=Streptomyces sp. NPDC002870 TaxID=3364666 RepID=UPI003676B495
MAAESPPGRPEPHPALPGATLTVRPGELQLWTLSRLWTGEELPPMAIGELDEGERERAASFVQPRDRLLYVSAHIALRRVLAPHLGIEPARVGFGRASCPCCGGPHGRPVLLDAPADLHFSLSHSHGLAVIAVARAPVGADVQRIPSPGTTELCLPGMHPWEQKEIAELPLKERPPAFAELWTRKEAYLKGIGSGLGRVLTADYLGGDLLARPPGWIVANVPGGPGHAAAVALLTDADHWVTARTLPTECLYVDDATDLIAAQPVERMALPTTGRTATATGDGAGFNGNERERVTP